MTTKEKLKAVISRNSSRLCLGLDDLSAYSWSKIQKLIEGTIDKAAAYKINFAYYCGGVEETTLLQDLLNLIRNVGEDQIPIILDVKLGDITVSSQAYADRWYSKWNVDALTLNPWGSSAGLTPFVKYEDKLNFIWIRSSTLGNQELQDHGCFACEDQPWQRAMYFNSSKKQSENVAWIFGANQIPAMRMARKTYPYYFFLVPGIGAQGGSIKDVVSAAKDNYLINIGRAITSTFYEQFDSPLSAAEYYRTEINRFQGALRNQ